MDVTIQIVLISGYTILAPKSSGHPKEPGIARIAGRTREKNELFGKNLMMNLIKWLLVCYRGLLHIVL